MRAVRMHLMASSAPSAQQALAAAANRYGQRSLEGADVVVAFGGDGFMLAALHQVLGRRDADQPTVSVFGVHHGTIGFLMNATTAVPGGPGRPAAELPERVAAAQPVPLVPLLAQARAADGRTWSANGLNEVTVRRAGAQAASLAVSVDGTRRLDRLAGDGLLLATPAGSAAYNFSAGGPVLPLTARALALTGICTLAPRRWPGAVLNETMHVGVDVLEAGKRPVQVTADMHSFDAPVSVEIRADPDAAVTALFDPGHDLDERLLAVQFA